MNDDARTMAAAEAIEDEAVRYLGRDLGTIHRNEIVAAGLKAADESDKAAGVYRVSLDAAIEAAAEAEYRRRHGDGEIGRTLKWESAGEGTRKVVREYVRPIVTAAVMGGAQ